MKEMDCVEVIVEKECYAKEGVHKGMQGWICDPNNFPQYGEKQDIATIDIEETDLKLVPRMEAKKNERIRALFSE